MSSNWEDMTLPSNFSVPQNSHVRRHVLHEQQTQNEKDQHAKPTPQMDQAVTVLLYPVVNSFLLNSFVSILILALILAILAFVLHFLYTEATKLSVLREAQKTSIENEIEGNFINARDTVAYYDRLVRH